MKRKTMTMMLCLLCTLALVSVGFASWVISTSTTVQQEGNIVVETVSDKRVNVKVEFLSSSANNQIIFGRPKDYVEKTSDWLINDKSGNEENFTLKFKVTITEKTSTSTSTSVQLNQTDKFEITLEADTKYTQLTNYSSGNYSNKNLVSELVNGDSGNVEVSKAYKEDGYYEVEVTIKNAWGSSFGNQNPYNYYNEKTSVDDSVIIEAYDLLKALETGLKDAKYTLKVVVKRNS